MTDPRPNDGALLTRLGLPTDVKVGIHTPNARQAERAKTAKLAKDLLAPILPILRP